MIELVIYQDRVLLIYYGEYYGVFNKRFLNDGSPLANLPIILLEDV